MRRTVRSKGILEVNLFKLSIETQEGWAGHCDEPSDQQVYSKFIYLIYALEHWKVGTRSDGSQKFKDPLAQKANGPIQGSNGMRYMTLFVDDVMAIVERLKAAGIALEGECPLKLGNGADFAVVKDPDGVFVELIGLGE